MDRTREMAKLLLDKLTKQQLSALCDMYDEGSFGWLFENFLLPKDAENFPAKYTG